MYENIIKRLCDIFISFFAILIFSPVLLTLFCLVKIDSPGPFIFKQERVGKMLNIFIIYKIRTMTQEASSDANDKNTGYITTSLNDKRITRIGNFLRKFHLDELPQFWNVLKGDMSIIGVRPDHISQQSDYSDSFWVARNSKRPGITGLSQVKTNKFISLERARNKYDMFYIKNDKKLKLDIYIFFMTILKMFKGESF